MTAEERIASLEAQLSQVLEQLRLTQEELRQAQEQLEAASKRIEELEKQKIPPPTFVKANVVKRQDDQKKARKKRDPKHNRARQRLEPTRIVEHGITDYGRALGPLRHSSGAAKAVVHSSIQIS